MIEVITERRESYVEGMVYKDGVPVCVTIANPSMNLTEMKLTTLVTYIWELEDENPTVYLKNDQFAQDIVSGKAGGFSPLGEQTVNLANICQIDPDEVCEPSL